MRKLIGLILAVMMLLIAIPLTTTNSLGDPVDSIAEISDSETVIIDAWIEIINTDGIEVWDSGEETNLRSDSYIFDGEKLNVNVIISDDNGIYQDPPSHIIDAYLSPDNYYLGELLYLQYIDDTTALFGLTFVMEDPEIIRCLHDVYIIINDGDPYTIFDYLYINPFMMAEFSQDAVLWTGLNPGDIGIASDYNPYTHNVEAYCAVGEVIWFVNVDYSLAIGGTDMTQIGIQDIIPVENIAYDMGSPPSTPLSLAPYVLGQFIANDPLTFNFYIDVPSIIQSGAYTGEINFIVELIL